MHRTLPIRKLLIALASLTLAGASLASPAGADAEHGSQETRTADAVARSGEPESAGSPESPGQSGAEHGKPASEPAPADQSGSTAASHQTEGTAGTNGSPTEPQPASNADYTDNGANTHGSYDSTRDGSPSGNGNGGGQATGKPCAGCVGAADNKNPAGQYPDGTDHNAGYECDRNHGIGRTNPAHTGCTDAASALAAAAVDTDATVIVAPGTRRVCSADAAMHSSGACSTASIAVVPVCPTGAVMSDAATCVAFAAGGICPSGTAMTADSSCVGAPACPSSTTMVGGTCAAHATVAAPACAVTGGVAMIRDDACTDGHVLAAGLNVAADPEDGPVVAQGTGTTQVTGGTSAPGSGLVHAVSAGTAHVVGLALAFTGASIVNLLIVAGLALATGSMLVIAGIRRRMV